MSDILEVLIQQFDKDGELSRGFDVDPGDDSGADSDTIEGRQPSNIRKRPLGLVDEVLELSGRGQLQAKRPAQDGDIQRPIEELTGEMVQYPEGYLGEVCARMHDQFRQSSFRYVTDIFHISDDDSGTNFCYQLRDDAKRYGGRRFLIICQHSTHVHVSHLCSYSNGSCRCAFIEKAKARGHYRQPNAGIRRPYASKLDARDCLNILLYFLKRHRDTDYLYCIIGGRVEGSLCRAETLEEQGHRYDPELARQRSLETCLNNDQVELSGWESLTEDTNAIRRSRNKRHIVEGGGKKKDLQKSILDMSMKYCVSPLNNICNHAEYLKDPVLQFIRADNKIYQSVMDTLAQSISNWSINDFYNMFTEPGCHPCFVATDNRPEDIYYGLQESKLCLITLLEYQFNGSYDLVKSFLTDLYLVLSKNSGKCNSILIYSPPSAGKNFFFDAVLCFFLNKGQLGNPNKHNHFAYQECVGKRILLWNEPNYELGEIEKLKMILGGDAFTVNVKNRQDVAVQRTPLIILTNRHVGFMSQEAFKDRLKQFRWRTAPYLKDYLKKPHPMSVFLLFKHYNIF